MKGDADSMEGTATTGMDSIVTGVGNLMDMASTMLNTVLENPVLATLFAAGFVGIAIGIVRKLKRS